MEVGRRGIPRDVLKLLAMIAMAIDHAAVFFVRPGTAEYDLMRAVGRISYPIFAVLFAEGCAASRTPVRRRLLFLCAAGLASEPFFDLMAGGSFFDAGGQCVMWSWALALVYLWAADAACAAFPGDQAPARIMSLIGLSAVFCWASEAFSVDYGLLHGLCLSAWRLCAGPGSPSRRRVKIAACAAVGIIALATPAAIAAVPPLLLEDRGGGGSFRLPRRAGHWFYPAHLAAYSAIALAAGFR